MELKLANAAWLSLALLGLLSLEPIQRLFSAPASTPHVQGQDARRRQDWLSWQGVQQGSCAWGALPNGLHRKGGICGVANARRAVSPPALYALHLPPLRSNGHQEEPLNRLLSPTAAQAPETSLETCLERIKASAAHGDFACLRRVYQQPITQWPAPHIDPGVAWQELAPLPQTPPHPDYNPATPEKIALGARLFDDPRLSVSGQIACANCHDRQLGWSDGRSVSFGHDRQTGRRNAISVAMSAFAKPLFWDGRAATLEEQALHPILDGREMAFTPQGAAQRLQQSGDYAERFTQVFGDDEITPERLALALAAFQRSLVPRFNRFDRFLEGRHSALNDQQLWGLHLFRTRARCMNCHFGAALTDNQFHNLGLHFHGRARQDLGRYEVTGNPEDSGKFRTPSLRAVGKTGPWMHNGLFHDLRGVMNMYNAGMPRPRPNARQQHDPTFPKPDPLLQPLDLHRSEIEAITEFLRTL